MKFVGAALVFVGVSLSVAARPAPPVKIGPISFDQLVGRADLIVVATVAKVDEPKDGVDDRTGEPERLPRVAHASALEGWKGKAEGDLLFRASGTWTCDTSTAVAGETDLLFLGEKDHDGIRPILHAGRGRMPVRTQESERVATLWSDDVLLPIDTATRAGPDARYDFKRDVLLDDLRKIVREAADRSLTLDDLVAKSDLIVVAIFDRLPEPARRPYESVDLQVVETWKGKADGDRIVVRVSPSWPIDTTWYEVGQKQLLFLSKARENGSRDVVEAGRGRLTFDRIGERDVAVAWVKDVAYPRELRLDADADDDKALLGRVDVAGLRKVVEKAGK